LHISDESQRDTANLAAAKLRSAGFIVPGIEYVGQKAPNATQVRYFQRDDEQGKDLSAILKTLNAGGIKAQPQFILLPSSAAVARHFELWFGRA
jgi:hypothetical protein